MVKNCDGAEVRCGRPAASCLGQHFQGRGLRFSLYEPYQSRQITYLFIFPAVNINWLTSGFVYPALPLIMAYVPPVHRSIRKRSNERTS